MALEIKTKNFQLKLGKDEVSRAPEMANIKIPKKEYTYAPLKTSLLPTPSQLRQAVITVEQDPRPMMDILRRLPEADSHIFAVANTRQLAILGYEWRVIPQEGFKDDEKEIEKCETIQNLLARTNFTEALTGITNGINFGHAVILPKWNLDAVNRYYPEFELIDGIHFGKKDGKVKMIADKNDKEFLVTLSESANITGVNDMNQIASRLESLGGLTWLDLDEENLIVVNSIPPVLKGWKKNYLGGLMRTGLYMTLLKYYNILDWAKFNELFGMPIRVGKYDPLLTKPEGVEILKTAVQNLGTDASAVIDSTMVIEFIETKSGNSSRSNTYEGFASYIETKQSIQFLGQNLTTENQKTGTYALGKVQEMVRMDYMWADMQVVQPLVNKIVEKMYFYNFGVPPEGVYPKFEFYTEESKDLTELSGVVRDLSGAGLEFSKKWAHETFNTKEPEDEDDSFGGSKFSPFNIPT